LGFHKPDDRFKFYFMTIMKLFLLGGINVNNFNNNKILCLPSFNIFGLKKIININTDNKT
jgi:hypothetical protein